MTDLNEPLELASDCVLSKLDMVAALPPGDEMSMKSGFYDPEMVLVPCVFNKNATGSLINTCRVSNHLFFISKTTNASVKKPCLFPDTCTRPARPVKNALARLQWS